MYTTVRLQVEGVDLADGATNELIAEHLADYLWACVDGLVTMTVYVQSGDITDQAIQAARKVEHILTGSKVRRVHRDLVTQGDIATRVGVSREAVRKWTKREGEKAFPTAVDTVGGAPKGSVRVWLWSDVVSWLERVYRLDMDENLPDDSTIAGIDACLAKVDGYLDREWQTVGRSSAMTSPLEEHLIRHLTWGRLRPSGTGTLRPEMVVASWEALSRAYQPTRDETREQARA